MVSVYPGEKKKSPNYYQEVSIFGVKAGMISFRDDEQIAEPDAFRVAV
jgi:hypothetical protein